MVHYPKLIIMQIQLNSIAFNHNPNSINTDGINIRKNKTTPIAVPEWVRGSSVVHEDSLACYAMSETNGNTLTIQAQFSALGDFNQAQIRAIDPDKNPPGNGGCAGLIKRFIKALTGNAIGEVVEKWVNFDAAGNSGNVLFDLKDVTIWNTGVSARNTTWQWQYRLNTNDPWINIEISKHKIYTILSAPTSAWSLAPNSDVNPWTEVLDYACNWAFASKDADTAATGITNNVFNLGPSIITYDCPGGGASHYSWGSFNCTKFLERLKGGVGLGQYVNCSDCATITSTFSNILGCDLWQSRMGWGFSLNPILAIGSNVWQTACGWSGFSYHEVAWKNNCDVNDNVFDACLKIDGDANPEAPPHTPMLVANLKFGDCNSVFYRRRLSPNSPGGCPNCAPQPQTKTRRTII